MKLAIVSDLHLNKAVYRGVMDSEFHDLHFRNADFIRAFRFICTKCIDEIKPDLVIINGDVWDKHNPSDDVRGVFSAQIYRLLSNNIPIIILIGNHDVCRKNHALKDLYEIKRKNMKVIEEPMSVDFKGHRLLLFPYSLKVERKEITIKEQFSKFIKDSGKSSEPTLFFGHFGVKGAKINEYEAQSSSSSEEVVKKKAFVNTNPEDISISDLDTIGAEYVFLGDYHRFQVLPTKKCRALYTGSIEKSDFSEVDQKKGFVVFDTEAEEKGEMGKCEFIEYPECRPMIELKGTILDMKDKFAEIDPQNYKRAIVKMSFIGTKSQSIDFMSELDGFKKDMVDKINPVYILPTSINVIDKDQEEKAIKLEEEIVQNGQISDSEILDVAIEIIKENVKDENEVKCLLELIKEIDEED